MMVDLLAGTKPRAPVNLLADMPKDHPLRDVIQKVLTNIGREQGGDIGERIGRGVVPAAEQLPTGIKEGLQTGYAGLTGGQFTPSPVPQESGAGFGRGLGQLLGQGAVAAPAAIAGGMVGGPAGAVAGGALGAGITTPGGLPERTIVAGETAALPVAGKMLGGLARRAGNIKLNALFHNPQPKEALQLAHAQHDALKNSAEEMFNYPKRILQERGVDTIEPSTDIMQQIKPHLGSTQKTADLFERAQAGDLDALHKVQSTLWSRGTKAKAGDLADFDLGEQMHELRDMLNTDIRNKLAQQGHLDAAHSYRKGQEQWKQLKDTYYNYPKIASVFDPQLRKIPKNIVEHFSEISKPMQDFLEKHPGLNEEIRKALQKKEAHNQLNKVASTTGKIGGSLYLGDKAKGILETLTE